LLRRLGHFARIFYGAAFDAVMWPTAATILANHPISRPAKSNNEMKIYKLNLLSAARMDG